MNTAGIRNFINKRKLVVILIVISVILLGLVVFPRSQNDSINNFDECAKAGNPIMDSHPEQCAANGKVFTNPNHH